MGNDPGAPGCGHILLSMAFQVWFVWPSRDAPPPLRVPIWPHGRISLSAPMDAARPVSEEGLLPLLTWALLGPQDLRVRRV